MRACVSMCVCVCEACVMYASIHVCVYPVLNPRVAATMAPSL